MNIHVDRGHAPLTYPFESRVLSLLEIRRQASEEIERLLALMDELDGDPDLEPDLAGAECGGEGDDALGGDADREPSLASPEVHPSAFWVSGTVYDSSGAQVHWTDGGSSDFEDDDDREKDDAEAGIGDAGGLAEQFEGEEEHDGSEPDEEAGDEDSGVGDGDGLAWADGRVI